MLSMIQRIFNIRKRLKRLERERPDSLPPVAERPQEEDPSVGRK